MASYWNLNDSKSPQDSRTLPSILSDLKINVVWMVSNRPLISKSSSPCSNHSMTVLSALITNNITVTFVFHCFFSKV